MRGKQLLRDEKDARFCMWEASMLEISPNRGLLGRNLSRLACAILSINGIS